VSGNLRFVSLAAGVSHTCGLTTTAQMYCWGMNNAGQLGAPSGRPCVDYSYDYYYYYTVDSIACAPAPQLVAGTPDYTSVAAGSDTCGLTPSGGVACYGAPGTLTVTSAMSFTSLTPDANCGIRSDGGAYCWSYTFDATSASFAQPVPIGSGFVFSAITGSQSHRCGLRQGNGTVLCWGANEAGQLGNGTQAHGTTPSFVLSPPSP
jgi:hypothetical protein